MKKYSHLFHFGALALALLLMASFLPFTQLNAAAEETSAPLGDIQDCFSIAATGRDGQPLEPINSGSTFEQFAYDKIENVVLTIKQEFLNTFIDKDKNDFIYTIDVIRAQMEGVSGLGNNITKTIENVFSGNLTDLENQHFEFYFDPPENCHFFCEDLEEYKDDGTYANIGWGLYQFKITAKSNKHENLGTTTGLSKNISIKPTTDFPSTIKIKQTVDSSRWEMQDAYIFELTDDCFKYCNQNLIKWYMCGESIDGTLYALTDTDLLDDAFLEYAPIKNLQKGMYNSSDAIKSDRFGRTFKFDAKTTGTWEIWCVINGTPVETHFKVTTGRKINTNILIWILVACGVALLGLVIFIIVYTKKREKVW